MLQCDKCCKYFYAECVNRQEECSSWICKNCVNPDGSAINDLPSEILQEIFSILCLEKESWHSSLALVCKKWHSIVDTESFRALVQRKFLERDFGAKNWSEETKQKYLYCGFSIGVCRECGIFFKERRGYYRDPQSKCTSYHPINSNVDEERQQRFDEKGFCRECAIHVSYQYYHMEGHLFDDID